MVSFILPFASTTDNLYKWKEPDSDIIILTTILTIQNINKTFSKHSYEIILVDNTNSFPDIKMPNLKIVKGLQYKKEKDISLEEMIKYNISDFENLTMWVSTAYNIGIEHAKGDYIFLQHNDVFYHNDLMEDIIELLDTHEYVTIDSKKINLTGYLGNKEFFDNLGIDIEIAHDDGGYLKTKEIGMADAYFFACKKEFFDDYIVDYGYGDTNHGATIKCLLEKKPTFHIGPYYENQNYETEDIDHSYILNGKSFVTHLKGGFSENKLSFKKSNNRYNMDTSNSYINKLIKST